LPLVVFWLPFPIFKLKGENQFDRKFQFRNRDEEDG
jgi:hypothetical protein